MNNQEKATEIVAMNIEDEVWLAAAIEVALDEAESRSKELLVVAIMALQVASEHLRQLSSGLGMGCTEGAEELAMKGASYINDTLDEIEAGLK